MSNRRTFLLAASGVALAASPLRLIAQPRFDKHPFTLGVASGYPEPSGIVLWTRLAPEPLLGGGMPDADVQVGWEVAEDESFKRVIRKGVERADTELGHSVHVELNGFESERWYWYRFHAGGATSAVGRFRTAPARDAANTRLRFALASCQHWEQGHFSAYRGMAADDLDLVVHVGDYIYESSRSGAKVREHVAAEPHTLNEYRNRYALYKSDPGLQAAHAAFPWMMTWDDHEVDNDYANDRSQDLDPPEEFLKRRAAAYQAYYEHMPLPGWARPRGPHAQIYTHARFGQLMQIHLLDDRQYRSYQACPRPGRGGSNIVTHAECPERLDPNRTMLGAEQERWLDGALAKSTARWNVIAQQTLMAQSDRDPLWGQRFWTDGWDGYPKARERLLTTISNRKVANPLVLGGDVHTAFVTDLKINFDDNRSPVVATEMLGPSITSRGPSMRLLEAVRHKNPHFKWANSSDRGYASFEITPERCITRMRGVASVDGPEANMRELATFVVENGRTGAQPV